MATESANLTERTAPFPVADLTMAELIQIITGAASGNANYKHLLDNFLTPNRNFDLELGEEQRQYNLSREDRLNFLDQINDGSFNVSIGQPGGPDDPIYGSLLAQQRADTQRLLGDIQSYGQGQQNRIASEFGAAENSALANLESRGLGASNLQTATRSGFTADRNQAMLDLNDQLLGKRLDLETNMLGNQYKTQTDQLDRNLERAMGQVNLIGNLSSLFK